MSNDDGAGWGSRLCPGNVRWAYFFIWKCGKEHNPQKPAAGCEWGIMCANEQHGTQHSKCLVHRGGGVLITVPPDHPPTLSVNPPFPFYSDSTAWCPSCSFAYITEFLLLFLCGLLQACWQPWWITPLPTPELHIHWNNVAKGALQRSWLPRHAQLHQVPQSYHALPGALVRPHCSSNFSTLCLSPASCVAPTHLLPLCMNSWAPSTSHSTYLHKNV